ncbi:glucose/arabinose dehydrogenase [Pontibacter ummariensis]|uniref:Glucose/arabinose dehydrogenase, beta-propeller fold n=1 Tax=Pontibacter ummariensis TaxID=1610492 RepID=A0A239JQ23_9BACT|nr:PQQ-dependent sugar dehydrogenase [Pontibacter ummariensis]PRY07377.1 glucose/arabinose dehydrogenase [Pontibacter ummariensis]SNT07981.1 Glucose/arabinose dehydrogenase, beta-propeller fold [Pontibacter ummariensis]
MRLHYLPQLLAMLLLMGCAGTADAQYELKEAYSNLGFDRPVEAVWMKEGTGRLYVLDQQGKIFWLSESADKTARPNLFLDISDRVEAGGEMGLLGLAFHPDYENNGYFYVNYTTDNPLQTRISQFKETPGNRGKVDPNSEEVLLTYRQPYRNHNGGKITFGPDGYLYIAVGDGGSGGDPQNNAQDRKSLLGKILRIDVNTTFGTRPYGIPADNPFANNQQGYREEIYAYGLRNPWKISFDKETGRLWAADVGQNKLEEIDIIEKGGNYGWRIMEGSDCYNPSSNCDQTGLIQPVHEYTHADGVSVTGGFVYRGKAIPELQGKYIYADYASGKVWALTLNEDGTKAANTLLLTTGFPVSSFGQDQHNELLLLRYGRGGKIYRLQRQVN